MQRAQSSANYWPREKTGIRTKPVLYYCASHRRWEPLTDESLSNDLCDFCCFHKPCPLGHDEPYWEEGWDEFAAEVEDGNGEGRDVRESYRDRYRRNEKENKDEEMGSDMIIDYLDLT